MCLTEYRHGGAIHMSKNILVISTSPRKNGICMALIFVLLFTITALWEQWGEAKK